MCRCEASKWLVPKRNAALIFDDTEFSKMAPALGVKECWQPFGSQNTTSIRKYISKQGATCTTHATGCMFHPEQLAHSVHEHMENKKGDTPVH